MLILLLLLGAILPLAITPGLLFHFDVSPKTVILAVTAAAALLRIKAIPAELASLWSRRGGRTLICLAALQVLWIGVATAASVRPWLSLWGSTWRQFGLLTTAPMLILAVLVAGHLSLRPQNIVVFLRIAVVAGVIGSLYGIAQYFDIDPFQPSTTYQAHSGNDVIVRPPGTLGHADYFAWWLAVEFFCALAAVKSTSPPWRIAGFACMACTGFATLLSGTRAALLAILVGAIAFALLSNVRIRRQQVIAGSLLLLLAVGFFFSPAGTRLRARVTWSGDEPAGGARPLLWRDSLRMAVSRPLAGFGPETFQSAFGPWQSTRLARLYPDFHHESPHNLALDTLTSQGVPGLLLLLAWGGLAFSAAARSIRIQPALGAPLAAALIGSATASLFDAAVLGPVLLTLLILAILVALEQPAVPRRFPIPTGILAPVCGILAAGAAAFALAVTVSDFSLAGFQRSPGPANSLAALRWQLPGTAEDIYTSRILLNQCQSINGITGRLECWRQAEQVAAHAVGTAGDPSNAWYNLAFFTAAQNDARGTEMALSKAIGSAPNWFKPHWMLARLLAQSGDLKKASAEAERADKLDSGRDPEVVTTLRQIRSGMH